MLFTRTLGYCILSIPIQKCSPRNQITCHGSTEVTIFHLRINIYEQCILYKMICRTYMIVPKTIQYYILLIAYGYKKTSF